MDFKELIGLMQSPDYKERFVAEYFQLKDRYEKLNNFIARIEAANALLNHNPRGSKTGVEMPKHDCPLYILKEQKDTMGEYLHILEVRAIIEGVSLVE